ncbi:MAG: glycosyltransferase family 2 protein [Clostridia bacterium]|nr:glycosyltransferase family 2 protein [Clostridia bacterium]
MVTILLAVYNGEKYLKAQIESILSQSFKDFKIIIRDDGSTDKSVDIINYYCNEYPDKISCMCGDPTGSAKLNFAELLDTCEADYIMFCDQDDVWLPTKIEKTLAAMQLAEDDGKTPVLVHTDLKVVDNQLCEISPSFFEFQKLYQSDITLPKLLVQNYVTGCTVMINRALRQKCGKIPRNCIMHDWWLALVAILFGKLICINEPTMLYRQHSDNQVGAKAAYGIALVKRKLATLDKVRENYNATYLQAESLLKHFGHTLSQAQRQTLEVYCKIKNMNKVQKIQAVRKYGFKKGTRLRIIGQYFLM